MSCIHLVCQQNPRKYDDWKLHGFYIQRIINDKRIEYNDLFVQSKENNNKLVFLTMKGMVTAMQMSQNNLTFLSKSSHIKLILFWRFVFHKSHWFEEEKILMLYVSRASDKCYLQTLLIDLSSFLFQVYFAYTSYKLSYTIFT